MSVLLSNTKIINLSHNSLFLSLLFGKIKGLTYLLLSDNFVVRLIKPLRGGDIVNTNR